MPSNLPANDQQRLLQVARIVRRRGVQAVVEALAEALNGGDLDDLERMTTWPITGKPSATLPGGVAIYGMPSITMQGYTIQVKVRP